MTVYVIAQLKMTDRAAYDRYQARFFEVFRKFSGRLLSADESPSVVEGDWKGDKLVLRSFPDEAAYHAWADLPGISGDIERPQSRHASHRAAREGICVSHRQPSSSSIRIVAMVRTKGSSSTRHSPAAPGVQAWD